MEYLKKTGMYKVMKKLLPEIEFPLMKNCTYKFYRGSEWLECYVGDTDKYELYRTGQQLDIKGVRVDIEDEGNKPIEILHRAYYVGQDGKIVKSYDAEETEKSLRETKEFLRMRERDGKMPGEKR